MKTFGHIRWESQKGKIGFSKLRGFTIIELMVVITVVAIITAFALPSYRMFIEKRQATSGAEQLAGFISTAQIEAVKRSENISVSYTRTDSENWCIGIVSGTAACTCMETDPEAPLACVIGSKLAIDDPQLRVITDANFANPDMMQPQVDWSFTYDPTRGLQQPPNPVDLMLMSEYGNYSINVEVSVTGRVKICNDASAANKVPGFKQCT